MKILIRLDKRSSKINEDGHPIIVQVTKAKKQIRRTIGWRSHPEDWDEGKERPLRSHPKYYELLDGLNTIQTRIGEARVTAIRKQLSIYEAVEMIFAPPSNDRFFERGLDLSGRSDQNTKYSALVSFNKEYPAVLVDEISRAMVEKWISKQLETRKPSGVDSYVRSLRAIWNKISDLPNPFAAHKIVIPPKINRVSSVRDLQILRDADLKYLGSIGSEGRYRDYWLLMFYLGGIDPEVLAKLRWDENVVRDRILFNREKGGSRMACNNIIPNPARELMEKYRDPEDPFLVPIHKSTNYSGFMKNFANRLKTLSQKLDLSVDLRPKSARYTFIDRAQQRLIDERVTAQIVGHKRKTTTSLYTNAFPLQVQDQAHLEIIAL